MLISLFSSKTLIILSICQTTLNITIFYVIFFFQISIIFYHNPNEIFMIGRRVLLLPKYIWKDSHNILSKDSLFAKHATWEITNDIVIYWCFIELFFFLPRQGQKFDVRVGTFKVSKLACFNINFTSNLVHLILILLSFDLNILDMCIVY